MALRNDKVVGAERYERPKQGDGPKVTTHSGVVVRTEKNDRYLIHNTPNSGVVATPAHNMSDKWYKTQDIDVKGNKTVGDALKGGYTSGSSRFGKVGEYLGSGTCKGTADGVTKALQK